MNNYRFQEVLCPFCNKSYLTRIEDVHNTTVKHDGKTMSGWIFVRNAVRGYSLSKMILKAKIFPHIRKKRFKKNGICNDWDKSHFVNAKR